MSDVDLLVNRDRYIRHRKQRKAASYNEDRRAEDGYLDLYYASDKTLWLSESMHGAMSVDNVAAVIRRHMSCIGGRCLVMMGAEFVRRFDQGCGSRRRIQKGKLTFAKHKSRDSSKQVCGTVNLLIASDVANLEFDEQ